LKLSEDNYDVDYDSTFGYRILCFTTVFSALSDVLVCHTCNKKIKITEASKQGLGFKIVVTCEECEPMYINSCPKVDNKAYEKNRRLIFAMRLLGIGINGIKKFCAFMCLPNLVFQSFYDKIVLTISIATAAVREKSMKNAAAKEKELSVQKGLAEGIVVSGDGTWKKRGFSSLLGVTSSIGWCTGKVIDVNVKSKICNQCNYWKQKEGTAEYEEWAETYKDSCEKNHEGSAGKMEVDAVIEMFQQSEKLHGLKYSHYVGDGDSKTFKGILDSNPHENLDVKKKECIDHVQKRMGTRLRNLKKNVRGLGGKGKLTGKLIDDLSLYFGLAIRRNHNSIVNMKKEIWATLSHKIFTDDNP